MTTEILSDIEWSRGDSYPIPLRLKVKDSDPVEYVDLSGYSFLMTVDSDKDPIDVATQQFQVVGVINPDQVTNIGRVHFTPTSAQTDLPKGKYWYDVQMIDTASYIRTIAKFKFTITQDITK